MKYAAAPNGSATNSKNSEWVSARTVISTNVPANTAAIPKTSVSRSTTVFGAESA